MEPHSGEFHFEWLHQIVDRLNAEWNLSLFSQNYENFDQISYPGAFVLLKRSTTPYFLLQSVRQIETKHRKRGESYDSPLKLYTWMIKVHIPDNRKQNADRKEEQSRYEKAMVVRLFELAELTFTVARIHLVVFSSHGDKCLHDVSQNEADTDEPSLAADEHDSGKQGQQEPRNREAIR